MKNTCSISLGSKGYYGWKVLNKNKEVIKQSRNNTDNVVTNDGAYFSLISQSMFTSLYAAVGTGTQEITKENTGLNSPVGSRSGASATVNRAGNEVDNGDGTSTITLTRTCSFTLGSVVGTISEVGLYTSATAGTFIAGQLIKDEFGNPTTVTILSDEQLVIEYTLEWKVPNTPKLIKEGVINYKGNEVPYEVWSQSYFNISTINASNNTFRLNNSSTVLRCYTQRNASGARTGLSGNSAHITDAQNVLRDSSRSVKYTATIVDPPIAYSANDISYIVFYSFSNAGPSNNDLNIEVDPPKVTDSPYNYGSLVIRFLEPIGKTETETLTLSVELTVEF